MQSLINNNYKFDDIENSILSNSNKVKLDDVNPFSFVDFLKYSQITGNDLFSLYNEYVKQWNEAKNIEIPDIKVEIKNRYIEFLRQIDLDYTNENEKRVFENIDWNNDAEILKYLNFYVTKIKEICIDNINKRKTIKDSNVKWSLKGNTKFLKLVITDYIFKKYTNNAYNFFNDFNDLVEINDFAKNYNIIIDELYDYNVYNSSVYTIDEKLVLSSIIDNNKFSTFTDILSANRVFGQVLDNNIFGYLSSEYTNIYSLSSESLSFFEFNDFIDYVKEYNSLKEFSLLNVYSKYIADDMFELSVLNNNSKITEILKFQNYNNIDNVYSPTVLLSSNTDDLKNEKNIGGYFTNDNLGYNDYISINSDYVVLSNINGKYLVADPKFYNSDEFLHKEYPSTVKNTIVNSGLYNKPLINNNLQRFYGYISRSESLKYFQNGVSLPSDSLNYWENSSDIIWKNSDIYNLLKNNIINREERNNDLLFLNKEIYKWGVDIYGNEYSLYKDVNEAPDDYVIIEQSDNGLLTLESSDNFILLSNDNFELLTLNLIPFVFDTFALSSNTGFINLDSIEYLVNCDPVLEDNNNNIYSDATTVVESLSTQIYGVFQVKELSAIGDGLLNFVFGNFVLVDTQKYLFKETNTFDLSATSKFNSDVTCQLKKPIFSRKYINGECYVRNTYAEKTLLLSSICNFDSLTQSQITEINTQLKDIIVKYNLIVLETENYLFFGNINFDYDNGIINIDGLNNNYYVDQGSQNRISDLWFDDINDTCYFTTLSSTIYNDNDVFIPTIYELDYEEKLKFKKIYNPVSINLSTFSFSDIVKLENISKVSITKNNDNNLYYVVCYGLDIFKNYYYLVYEYRKENNMFNLLNFYPVFPSRIRITDAIIGNNNIVGLSSFYSTITANLTSGNDVYYNFNLNAFQYELSSYRQYTTEIAYNKTNQSLSSFKDTILTFTPVISTNTDISLGKMASPFYLNISLEDTGFTNDEIVKIVYRTSNDVIPFDKTVQVDNKGDIIIETTANQNLANTNLILIVNPLSSYNDDNRNINIFIDIYDYKLNKTTYTINLTASQYDANEYFWKMDMLDVRSFNKDNKIILQTILNTQSPDYIIQQNINLTDLIINNLNNEYVEFFNFNSGGILTGTVTVGEYADSFELSSGDYIIT